MLCGSAYRNRGIEPLLDAVVAYLPSPLDVPAVARHGRRPAPPSGPPTRRRRSPRWCSRCNATATGRLTYLRVYSGTLAEGGHRAGRGHAAHRAGRPDPAGPGRPARRGGPGGGRRHRRGRRAQGGPRRGHPVRAGGAAGPRTAGGGRTGGLRGGRGAYAAPTPTGWPRRWPGWSRRTRRWRCGPTRRPARRVLSGHGRTAPGGRGGEDPPRPRRSRSTVGRPQVAYRETVAARGDRPAVPARQAGRRRRAVRPRRARRGTAGARDGDGSSCSRPP